MVGVQWHILQHAFYVCVIEKRRETSQHFEPFLWNKINNGACVPS